MCIEECLPACMSVYHLYNAHKDQRRALDPLELDLQVVMNSLVGVVNQTQILCKSNKYSYLLNDLPNSLILLKIFYYLCVCILPTSLPPNIPLSSLSHQRLA